jgi:hypothetical protein
MRIRLLDGRPITREDGEHTQPVGVVNEAFARRNLGGASPIGEQIRRLHGHRDGNKFVDDYVRVVEGTEKAVAALKTFEYRVRNSAKKRIYPQWVCSDCATSAGGKVKGTPTWHTDKCGVCGRNVAVTQPRDFGNPAFYTRR